MKSKEALEKFREEMVIRRLARKTREQYEGWAKRFLWELEKKRLNTESAEAAVTSFLSMFSAHSVAHQKGALNALAGRNGFYACLGRELGKLPEWVNAVRPPRMPVWVTKDETERILAQMEEPWSVMVALMYGSGLRVGECVSLRWRDIDLERMTVTVRSGKGDKDRVTVLSSVAADALRRRMPKCQALWAKDRARQRPGVAPVEALARKFPKHGEHWAFFWVFPAAGESRDPETGMVRRHHLHEGSLNRVLREAVERAGIPKRVTCHAFRHGFATLYLLMGGNIEELRVRLGHASLETTMIYTHCVAAFGDRIGSPWDAQGGIVPMMKFKKAL